MAIRNALIVAFVFVGGCVFATGLPHGYQQAGVGAAILATAGVYGWLARRRQP